MQPFSTTALLLDRVPYAEKDLVVTLLTKDYGLISAVAHSARGSRHRFVGGLDYFVVFGVTLTRSRRGLASLTATEPVRQFPGIFEDFERLRIGQGMLLLARDLLCDAPSGPDAFEHVVTSLARLEVVSSERASEALLRLCLELLADIGHPPTTGRCPECNGAYTDQRAVLRFDGLLLCRSCSIKGMEVDRGVLEFCLGKGGSEGLDKSAVERFVTALASVVLSRPWRMPL